MSNDKDLFAAPSSEELKTLKNKKSVSNIEYSPLESAGRGLIQNGLMGFGDEIAGGINNALDLGQAGLHNLGEYTGLDLANPSPSQVDAKLRATGTTGNSLLDDKHTMYSEGRDQFRAEDKAAQEQNPLSYLGGGLVGGGLTLPLIPGGAITGATTAAKIGSAALTGAKLGAISGLGSSDADLADSTGTLNDKLNNIGQAATDTAIGAGIGGITGGIVQSAPGSALAGGAIAGGTGMALSDADTLEGKALDGLKYVPIGMVAGGLTGKGLSNVNQFIKNKTPLNQIAGARSEANVPWHGKELADSTHNDFIKTSDEVGKVLYENQKLKYDQANTVVNGITDNLSEITDLAKKKLSLEKESQISDNLGKKGGLQEKINDVAKNMQQKFGENKIQVAKGYDAVEAQIPDSIEFNVIDNLADFKRKLNAVTGVDEVSVNKTLDNLTKGRDINNLSYPEFKYLRGQVKELGENQPLNIKSIYNNLESELNNNRANTLLAVPETQDLGKQLSKLDYSYALINNMEKDYFGEILINKNANKVFTDTFSKENAPNSQMTKTTKDLLDGNAQKLTDNDLLTKKLDLLNPDLRKSIQPDIDSLLAENQRIKNFEPNISELNDTLNQNPEYARLQNLLEQSKGLVPSKPNLESTQNDVFKRINNINQHISTPGKLAAENIVSDYQTLTGKNMAPEFTRLAENNQLLGKDAQELSGSPSLKSLGFIKGAGMYVAGAAGKTRSYINTIRDATTGDISNVISTLKNTGTPEAAVFSKMISDKAAAGPQSRSALMMSLMQQPGYRAIMNQNKKNEDGNK